MNEIRNELLLILSIYNKENNTIDKNFYVNELLNRFEYHLLDQLKDLEYKEKEIKDNLETLKFVRSKIQNKDQ